MGKLICPHCNKSLYSCNAILGNTTLRHCGEPATWKVEWSDRVSYVCDEHRDWPRQNHNGDHDYDKTGILWTNDSITEFESKEALSG